MAQGHRSARRPRAGRSRARLCGRGGFRRVTVVPRRRDITLVPSVHYGMNVSVYGKLDVRQVRTMMIKPVSSLTMAFRSDPYEGMQTARFAGAAVTFLPTVTYGGNQQASLR